MSCTCPGVHSGQRTGSEMMSWPPEDLTAVAKSSSGSGIDSEMMSKGHLQWPSPQVEEGNKWLLSVTEFWGGLSCPIRCTKHHFKYSIHKPPRISKAAKLPAFGLGNPKYTINQLCLCVIIHLLQPQFPPM